MKWLVVAGLCLAGACAPEAPEIAPLAAPDRQDNFSLYLNFWFSAVRGQADRETGRGFTQAAATVGREDMIVAEWGPDLGLPECPALPGDPIAEIVERAGRTNIVIINEAHDSPRDRYFIGQVAEALWPLGYETFAAETFNNGAELNHDLVYYDDGFYSAEPIFGRMMSKVKALGYQLVAYEQTPAQAGEDSADLSIDERIARREAAQAENLMAAIFREDPDRKVLIHVGYGHVSEGSLGDAGPSMTRHLATITGRDPLTISQTNCIGGAGRAELAEGTGNNVDLMVAHPPLELADGRPAWRLAIGDRAVRLPETLLEVSETTIFEARPVDAYIDTVPTDRLLLAPGEDLPLLLPPGRYRIDRLTTDGHTGEPPTLIRAK